MKKHIVIFVLVSAVLSVKLLDAQKYITKNGHIWFKSETPVETIEAHNQQVNCALDVSSGDLVFKVLIKSFEFPKALMQEHFNENYLESGKYPLSTFTGKILNLKEINFTKDAKYTVEVEGDLTIHGITKKVKEKGVLEVKGGQILLSSDFTVLLTDYDIKVPKAVIKNIAESIDVHVGVKLDKLNK